MRTTFTKEMLEELKIAAIKKGMHLNEYIIYLHEKEKEK